MASVHEFEDLLRELDQQASPESDGAAAAQPSWIRRHVFAVFLAGSLIFHLGLVTAVSFFDFRWVAPWMSFRELPVELINEEQIQKEDKKAGSADAKERQRGQSSAAAKDAQADMQVKPPEARPERPVQPPREPQTAANKQKEVEQKEPQQKEVAKQAIQKPDAAEMPKPAETQPPAASTASPRAQDQQPPVPQQQQTPSTSQQTRQAAPSPASAPTRLPTFMYQPNDGLSLAVPVPLPANDAGAEPVSYKLIVFGMLERAKNYPQSARERHAAGNVIIAFSIDDTGQPKTISMLQSSGQSDLDSEALALISRAAPFPVPPAGAQRDFAVNIGFSEE